MIGEQEMHEGPSPTHLAMLRKRMAAIDELPPEWRALVHEYGWTVICHYYRTGMKAKTASHLIRETLNGAWEIRERRRSNCRHSMAGERVCKALHSLGLPGNGHAVAAAIYQYGGVILPMMPTNAMVEASMEALNRRAPIGWLDKPRKHRFRLIDALQAGAEEEHGGANDDGA